MVDDEIVREIRSIRDAYASQFNYDVRAIYRDLKKKEKTSGRKYYDFSLRSSAGKKRPRAKTRTK